MITILKILDIPINQLSNDFLSLIVGHESWKDTDEELGEHIYQVTEVLYNINWENKSEKEIKEIAILCNQFECDYFRIVTV